MTSPRGTERRDPFSPLLRLGTVLAQVRNEGESGWVEVRDRGRLHRVRVARGGIADVHFEGRGAAAAGSRVRSRQIVGRAARLFRLERPHSIWIPSGGTGAAPSAVDPLMVVLSGVRSRRDLFDPLKLVERVPADALSVPPERLARLRAAVELSPAEDAFLSRLELPTPIPMILWKRGLDPRHAGSLLVGLNLVGFFGDQWEPGLLPRVREIAAVMRKLGQGASDVELLGLVRDPSPQEIDRAFRRLSFVLHPDRLGPVAGHEADRAREAFVGVSGAYERLRRRSRRERPVRGEDGVPLARVKLVKHRPDSWGGMLDAARRSLEAGDCSRARAFAVKALALSPPPGARRELLSILAKAA
jgi:hypothetical protein